MFDVCVIGGGIVGLSILRELTLRSSPFKNVVLVEAKEDVLSGASSGNSGILHPVADINKDINPIEFQMMRSGYKRALKYLEYSQLPHKQCGCVVVAWSEEEMVALKELYHNAHEKNGVKDVEILSQKQLHLMVPSLSTKALGALHIPGEVVFDSWIVPTVSLLCALRRGATLIRNFDVINLVRNEERGAWVITSSAGNHIDAKIVIQCAGINADRFHESFQSVPRRGQFEVFRQRERVELNKIIYSVPTPTSKGILVCQTVHGLVFIGPTAQDQKDKNNKTVNPEVTEHLVAKGKEIIPSAMSSLVHIHSFVGIRTASSSGVTDYIITNQPNYVGIYNIRSTGATASLGIAHDVVNKLTRTRNNDEDEKWNEDDIENLKICSHMLLSSLPPADERASITIQLNENITYQANITHPLTRWGWDNQRCKL